jgi:hypothetical protein
MLPFRTEYLKNGVTVEFVDLSNRYFGDYHRVCIEIRMIVPDNKIQRVRRLERMGVAGADVESTRNLLAENYWQHAGRYLAHAEYPARLAAVEATTSHRLKPIDSRT